jgi:glycosyltransferase involved in cell wall biosynthesis
MPRLIRNRDRDTLRWNEFWSRILEDFLRNHPADLIITQNRVLYSTVEVARAHEIPVVVWGQAWGMLCPMQFKTRDPLRECTGKCRSCLPLRRRVFYNTVHRNLSAYEQGLRNATLVLSNSAYMQQVIRKLTGVESEVMYGMLEVKPFEVAEGSHDRVLFIKPQYVKGRPIFLEIAKRMPDTRFIVAGSARSRARRELRALPNVELLGWIDDMREVYARTRVLLGPAIWPEPFGRVYVEAAAAGVPSVASARGGLPEAVGDGGILIDDIFDIDRWVAALREFEDPATYSAYAARASEHAKTFSLENTLAAFVQAVEDKTGLAL